MRLLFSLLLLCWLTLTWAVEPPVGYEVIEDIPPPPKAIDEEINAEPQITIIKKGAETIEEFRINGEMYMMKVTPDHGVPYYLMKEDQDGGWARYDGPSPPLSIPKWVIFRF